MNRRKTHALRMVAGLSMAVWSVPASAQSIITGQNPLDNAAAAGARAPGDMVATGVSLAFDIHDAARGGLEITATEPTTSIRAQALADSIAALFNQLNQAITLLHGLLLERGGRSASAANLVNGTTEGTTTGNQTGGRRKAAGHLADSRLKDKRSYRTY